MTLRDGEVIDVEPGNTEDENYGIAVDIGTTTVVVMLWNLRKGSMEEISAVTNPQGAYGADVISRITFVMEQAGNLSVIHKAVIDCINRAIEEFAETLHIRPQNIYRFAVVGNTTMSHIFLQINPSALAVAPLPGFSPEERQF